jgi:hypothetical protein
VAKSALGHTNPYLGVNAVANFLPKIVIRIVGGVVIVGAITVLTNSFLPVASHKSLQSAGTCSVTASTVGGALAVNGSGFAPSTQYLLYLTSPGGNGETTANTDSTGHFTYSTWAYWKGTYGASAWSEGHSSSLAANCASATVS